MTPEERSKLIQRLEEQLQSKVRAAQSALYARISRLVDGLSRDDQGRIKNNIANLTIQNRLVTAFNSFRVKQTGGLVKWFIRAVTGLLTANRTYFRGINDLLLPNIHKLAVRKTMIRLGIDGGKVKPGGWLDSVTGTDNVKRSVMQRFASAVLGGQDFKSFTKGLAQSFTSGGIVEKEIGGRLGGVMIQVDREVQDTYRARLGLKYALYSGTIMERTRNFCERRNGRVYSADEIQSWNGQTWDGKIPGVDAAIQGGGYNCRHNLSWMTRTAAVALADRIGKPINSYA